MIPYFEYGAEANDYLRKKDKRLGSVMDAVGHIRGLRMVYRHKKIDRKLFEKYRRRYSPFGSVASLYLWEFAGGAIPKLHDPAAQRKKTSI